MAELCQASRLSPSRACHLVSLADPGRDAPVPQSEGKAGTSGLALSVCPMPQVRLIIDLITPGVGIRRAERTVTLQGVPAVGEFVDTIPGPTLALSVTVVRWQAADGTVTLFLGAGESKRPGITQHEGGLELADHMVEDLAKAGWTVDEYE